MELNTLFCISPVDGRYRNITDKISEYFSEYAYIKYRIKVEIEWLKYILTTDEIVKEKCSIDILDEILNSFDIKECERVKEIEKITNHDVKAIEYYIREKIKYTELEKYSNFVHFACTSEDINNIAYNIMISSCLNDVVIPCIEELISNVKSAAIDYKNVAMLSHTHGQPATPTTVGKELAVFVYRWNSILNKIKNIKLKGKFNGAVGNFSAYVIAYDIDWIEYIRNFVESLDMEYNPLVTQIESHDTICELFSLIKLYNNVTLDFNQDMWTYISKGYFKQKTISTETGSSVMPHKVNPINHENSMANIHMANSIIDNFTCNLQISRMQRDLSDSSNLRNIGVMFSHCVISVRQSIIAFSKMEINEKVLDKELENNPEVLAEAIQTILRKNGYNNAYEILKEYTRGKNVTKANLRKFIISLDINSEDKEKLLNLNVNEYVGLSSKLVDYIN
jgi:adenylosuccinate lyase